MPQFIPDARFDNIRKFAHENFVAHDDIRMRFDMLVDQLRVDSQKEQRSSVPQFILKIDLGNDAMRAPIHIRDALRAIADKIRCDDELEDLTQNIRDYNGNVVGHYEVVDS